MRYGVCHAFECEFYPDGTEQGCKTRKGHHAKYQGSVPLVLKNCVGTAPKNEKQQRRDDIGGDISCHLHQNKACKADEHYGNCKYFQRQLQEFHIGIT